MDSAEVIRWLQGKGKLVTPQALDIIMKSENPEELADIALENVKEDLVIDAKDLEQKEKTKIAPEKEVIVEKSDFRPLAKDIEARVKILKDIDVKDSSSLGTLDDFVEYFNNRYEQMYDMLKNRGNTPFVQIKNLDKATSGSSKIVCMINEKNTTKNGHILLRAEDQTGNINILVPKNSRELLELAGGLVTDEVIAVEGRLSKELFIADNIHEPEIPIREPRKTDEEVSLAMLSDMHIGSKLFMEKNFNNFLDWLKGKYTPNMGNGMAGRVKYITIAGDLVAGIGVYPRQEEELEITDIYDQYEKFIEYIAEIPEYIHVVISPGNHDGVKKADPQPRLPKELAKDLYDMNNVTLVSSPGMVELHGLKTLLYHGTSFIDFVSTMPGMSFDHGARIMVEMLKKRHVHPIYGGKPITPERKDSLVISEVPDIFHTGESHNNSYEIYHGTICVNSGTWENITEYQIAQGHKATPCILPVIDMRRAKIGAVHFDR